MEDMSDKLSSVLNDPESLQKIKKIAEMLGGGTVQTEAAAEGDVAAPAQEGGLDLGAKLLPLISTFSQSTNDPKIKLLLALRPYLREERLKSLDDAVMVLKLSAVASKAIKLF